MKKTILFFSLLLSALSYSQILDEYPAGQRFYNGGITQFYEDFHNVLLEKELSPCENKKELLLLKFIVFPDKTIKFAKDADSLSYAANKCTYELSKEVFADLDGWQPAMVNNENKQYYYPALVKIYVYPDDLFENFHKGYNIVQKYKKPEFPGGTEAFSKMVGGIVDLHKVEFGFLDEQYTMYFNLNKNSEIINIEISPKPKHENLEKELIYGIKGIRKKWKPATIHDIPVDALERFRFPVMINVDISPDNSIYDQYPSNYGSFR
jgi:hypothetical protein